MNKGLIILAVVLIALNVFGVGSDKDVRFSPDDDYMDQSYFDFWNDLFGVNDETEDEYDEQEMEEELECEDADADGYSTCDNDCDDGNYLVSPAAAEVCGDGIDNDCSGGIDCADGSCDGQVGPPQGALSTVCCNHQALTVASDPFDNDVNNCGACGVSCGPDQKCVSGECKADCSNPPGDECFQGVYTATTILDEIAQDIRDKMTVCGWGISVSVQQAPNEATCASFTITQGF